jgi:AcrR family transcriptional regulator
MLVARNSEAAAETQDGRVRRGEANRERILEALYELVGQGTLQPTAEQVARRAGVGERTVFRHFEDMETLYAEIDARLQREFRPILAEPIQTGSLEARVASLVERRVRVFDHALPYFRAAQIHRHRSKFLSETYSSTRRELREELVRQLAPEIEGGDDLVEAIELLLTPDAYDRLRGEQRLGRDRVVRLLEGAVLALLKGRR